MVTFIAVVQCDSSGLSDISQPSNTGFCPVHFPILPLSYCFALLQTPWIPKCTIFPRLMLHPDGQCLTDLQFGVSQLQPRGTRGFHCRTPYFQVMEKVQRCKSHTAILCKGILQFWEICCSQRCLGWSCFLPSLPHQHLAALHSDVSCQLLPAPTWSSFSRDRNTKTHQGKVLACRFLGQI